MHVNVTITHQMKKAEAFNKNLYFISYLATLAVYLSECEHRYWY